MNDRTIRLKKQLKEKKLTWEEVKETKDGIVKDVMEFMKRKKEALRGVYIRV